MRTVIHLSDLHFGRIDTALIEPLLALAHHLRPHAVVVSGDLTQRARAWQFRAARAFLDRLPQPLLVVPGNHDVPLYNLAARFLHPLANYRRHINADTEPYYVDDEIAIAGLNTARSLAVTEGRISRRQAWRIRERFSRLPPGVVKLLVTHHPVEAVERDARMIVGRAAMAMSELARSGVDLLLSGHLHDSVVLDTAPRYGHPALVIHAGTALSTRTRYEPNAFNVLRIGSGSVGVEQMGWDAGRRNYRVIGSRSYQKTSSGWHITGA